jgi:hypothetical protein
VASREAVAQHHLPRRQRRLDDVPQVVAPGGKHQQRLGQGIHGRAQQALAQRFGQRGAAGLAGHRHRTPLVAQPLGQRGDVGRFAGAVDAFEGDEKGLRSIAHGSRSYTLRKDGHGRASVTQRWA